MMELRVRTYPIFGIALCAFLLGTACASKTTDDVPRPEEPPRVSPLGLGNPDPAVMLDAASRAADTGQTALWFSYFGFYDQKTGEYFAGDPVRLGITPEEGAARMRAWAGQTRMAFDRRIVDVRFLAPRNVRNTPPSVEVPTTMIAHPEQLAPGAQAAFTAEINRLLPPEQSMTWNEIAQRVQGVPTSGTMRFVYLDGAWRFDTTGAGAPRLTD